MAIIDNLYQDKIMGGLEGDPDPYNFNQLFEQSYIEPVGVPGMDERAINFKDAPVSFGLRQNNPFVGPIDNFILSRGNPDNNIINRAKSAISSGIGKGIDLGKSAIGGIASLATGIPGIGLLLNALQPMSPEEEAMRDFYGDQFGLTDTGQIASGIMQGYNPVSLTGFGLSDAIDKRIARINKTLDKQRKDKKRKESDVLKQRLQALEALKAKEAAAAAAALEKQRRGRRPTAPSGDGGGVKDSGGPTGGYSYDAGGRQGFGFGLKDGGLAGLL